MGTIGERLREWAVEKYGSVQGLADALHKPKQSLQPYLRNSSKPGPKLQSELRELGCDIEWLMTGVLKIGLVPDNTEKRHQEDIDFKLMQLIADESGEPLKIIGRSADHVGVTMTFSEFKKRFPELSRLID